MREEIDVPRKKSSSELTDEKIPCVRRLSKAEMEDRRSKGSCFNCNERFTVGQKCKRLFYVE